MWDYVKGSKVASGQADRIVMNLEDTPVSVNEVREQFVRHPIQGLKEVVGIKGGKVFLIYP